MLRIHLNAAHNIQVENVRLEGKVNYIWCGKEDISIAKKKKCKLLGTQSQSWQAGAEEAFSMGDMREAMALGINTSTKLAAQIHLHLYVLQVSNTEMEGTRIIL